MAKPALTSSNPIDSDYDVPHILADSDAIEVTYTPANRLMKITFCSKRPRFGERNSRPLIVARVALTVPAYNSLARMLQDVAKKIAAADRSGGTITMH